MYSSSEKPEEEQLEAKKQAREHYKNAHELIKEYAEKSENNEKAVELQDIIDELREKV